MLLWHRALGRFPTIHLLERYAKLAWSSARRADLLECPLDAPEARAIPFELAEIPYRVGGARPQFPEDPGRLRLDFD